MHAKLILNFIRGKTVDYASKKIQRWYRESYDDSPKAFSFLKKDVEMVLDILPVPRTSDCGPGSVGRAAVR